MIALLQSPTDRTTAFAASWHTALDMHAQASEAIARGEAFVDGCGALRPTATGLAALRHLAWSAQTPG